MNESANIKQDLLSLISKVNNSNLLELAYQILSESSTRIDLMNQLSAEQSNELNQSITESFDEKNLVGLKDAKSSLDKWLKK